MARRGGPAVIENPKEAVTSESAVTTIPVMTPRAELVVSPPMKKEYTRRDFLKVAIPAVVGVTALTADYKFNGPITSLVKLLFARPKEPSVVLPPGINSSIIKSVAAEPAPIVLPKYSPIPEWDGTVFLPPLEYVLKIRERIEEKLPEAKKYPDVLATYPYFIVKHVSMILPFFGGGKDTETAYKFYLSLEPEFINNLRYEIEDQEKGRRPFPLVNNDGNGKPLFADHRQYLMNLGHTLFTAAPLDWDPRTGPVGYDPVTDTRRSRTVDDLKQTFARNVNNKKEVKEEILEELNNPKLFRELVEKYMNWVYTTFERRSEKPVEDVVLISREGMSFEKLAIADRGHTIGLFHHDTGRGVTVSRLWTGGAVGYGGTATVRDSIKPEGTYGYDGIFFIPLSDATKSKLRGVILDNYTQSWSRYTSSRRGLDTLNVNGGPIKEVRIGLGLTNIDASGKITLYKQ